MRALFKKGKRLDSTSTLWLAAVILLVTAGWRLFCRHADDELILSRRIVAVDFDEVPLHEALHHLASAAGTSISPEPNNFTGDPIWETRVNLHLRDVTLEKAFECIMNRVAVEERHVYGAYAPPRWSAYRLEQYGDRLTLSKSDTVKSIGCVYDIHEIVERSVAWPETYRGPDLYTPATGWDVPNRMLLFIEETIVPDEWADNGGRWMIARVGQSLYINAPPSVQQQVRRFLQQLREVDAMAASEPPKPR